MKSNLVAGLLLTAFISSSSFASLPDEINYEPYKQSYFKLVDQVNELTSQLESLMQNRDHSYTEEQNLERLILQLRQTNAELRGLIRDNEIQISSLITYNRELEIKISKLTDRQNRLDKQARKLNRQIQKEEDKLAPIREKMASISKRIERKRIVAKRTQDELKKAREISQKIKSQLDKQVADKKAIKQKIASLNVEVDEINSKIANAKASIETAKKSIASQKTTLDSEQLVKENLVAQVEALKKELQDMRDADSSNPEIRPLRVKIDQKNKELKVQLGKVKSAKSALKNAKVAKQSLVAKLTKQQKRKETLPKLIADKKGQLKAKNEIISTKRTEFASADAKRIEKRDLLDSHKAEIDKMVAKKSKVINRLNAESQVQLNLIAELNEVNAKHQRVSSNLNNNIVESNRVLRDIRQREDQIPRYESSIQANAYEINKSIRELKVVQERIDDLLYEISNKEVVLADTTSDKDEMYGEYTNRENLYGVKLSNAKAIGENQSDIAYETSTDDSNIYVVQRSSQLGVSLGSELAKAQGNFWGVVRAEIKGYNVGFEAGYASSEDSQRGTSEGDATGIEEAQNYATSVLKPQFFNKIFQENIDSSQSKSLNVEFPTQNISSIEKELMEFTKSFTAGITPISASELNDSYAITTPLDTIVLSSKKNLSQIESEVTDLANAANAYEAPSVPYGSVHCDNVYKQVQVFKTACKNEYTRTYKTKYLTTYFQNFESQYRNLYENTLEAERSRNIEVDYESQYDSTYPVANKVGVTTGKETIYNESFEVARAQAYAIELPKASNRAEITALGEVKNWINTNATLTIADSKIAGENLKGGSITNLALSFKNISPTELKKPVKIVLLNTNNFDLEATEYFLNNASGDAITDFSKIRLKVSDGVRSNQKLSIAGKVILAGGKYRAQREEFFSADAISVLNPAVNSELKYTTAPRVVTRFRSRTLVHNLNIEVAPAVETIKAGYTVKLSIVEGSEGLVKLKNSTYKTGRLNEGNSKKIKFRYTFLLAARQKTVKLKLSYTHKGTEVKSEIIELKPF